jgi:hypothetical protein
VAQGGSWERASFTVPTGTSEERVQSVLADRKMSIFGDVLERQDFKVLMMAKPERVESRSLEPDRTRYVIWAFCRRRPVEHNLWVPDAAVPAMERQGMELKE